jgi:hypothetical protein
MSQNGDNQRVQGQQKEDQQQGYQDDWSSAFDHLLSHDDGDQGNMNGVTNNPFSPYQILVHPSQEQTSTFTVPAVGTGSSRTNTFLPHPVQNQPTIATSSIQTTYPTSHPPMNSINNPTTPTATPLLQSTSLVAASATSASSPAPTSDTVSLTGTDADEGQGTKEKAACERKRNREKQRRNDVNQQFTDLTSLLKSIEESEDKEYEVESVEVGIEGAKKQRLGKGFYGRTGPTNRIDLIARTIVVLEHLWTESRERSDEIKSLKHQLNQAKNEIAKTKSDAATSSAQNKPQMKEQPMMMMVPMMMPSNPSCGGGSQSTMAMQNPMQSFMGQMSQQQQQQQQQGFMPFPFMPPHQGFMHMQNPVSSMAMPQGIQVQQQQQYHHHQQQQAPQQRSIEQQSVQQLQAQGPHIAPMNIAQGLANNVQPGSSSQGEDQAAQNVPIPASSSGAPLAPDSPNAGIQPSASEEAKQSGDESGGLGSNNNLAHCA